MSYCTTNEVKAHLGISGSGDDTLLATYVTAATSFIDAYCHREFEATESTRYVDAIGEHIRGLTLYIDHVGELASITTVTNGDGIEVASAEYVTTPRNEAPYYAIRIKSSAGKVWDYATDWEDAIAITGIWAYSETAPSIINQACIQLAAFYYRQKDQPFTDVTAVEAGIVVRPVGLPAHIKAMLDKYRKP